MLRLFFDCEFTHLMVSEMPVVHLPDLVSIGIVTADGAQHFYAENSDADLSRSSDFTKKTVLPLLADDDCRMPSHVIALRMREWIEALDQGCVMVSDAPHFDWPPVRTLFEQHGWPSNLARVPAAISFDSAIQSQRFKATVAEIFRTQPELRRHHALDDAKVNAMAFRRTTARRF